MKTKRTVSFTKNSTNIFFHLLTRCNLNCRYCYINKKQHGHNTLPIETINTWLDVFTDNSKTANVIFLGGEPTLHPDLSPAIKKAKEAGYSSITVDTNGYLFNDILSKVDPDDVDYFSFSLDGATSKTNDMLRGAGVYEKCIAGIKQAVSKGFNASLIYTVSRTNIDELSGMVPLLEELNIDKFFIQVIGVRGKAAVKSNNSPQVSRSEWLSIIPEVAEKIAETGIPVTYPKVFLNPDEPFECAGLVANNYFIFPNGRVYRCPLCEDFPIHSLCFDDNKLVKTEKINESNIFGLNIPEGCVMNKIIQPENINYNAKGLPEYKIACCMLKEEINGRQ